MASRSVLLNSGYFSHSISGFFATCRRRINHNCKQRLGGNTHEWHPSSTCQQILWGPSPQRTARLSEEEYHKARQREDSWERFLRLGWDSTWSTNSQVFSGSDIVWLYTDQNQAQRDDVLKAKNEDPRFVLRAAAHHSSLDVMWIQKLVSVIWRSSSLNRRRM